MKKILAVFKREFRAYFDSPVAYVFLTAFLVLVGFLTFTVTMLYERRQADLAPFFFWHPWVYLLLVPAATMGLWADERRNGTAELLLTLPVTLTQALIGKFLAAWSFMGVALALTVPVAFTIGYLGSPDWGAVFCGYFGSFLLAGAASAVGIFASSLSRSSVVGFVVSLAMTFALLIIGFDPVIGAVANWGVPTSITDAVASCSLLSHFEAMRRGVLDMNDIAYYLSAMAIFLAAAQTVTNGCGGGAKRSRGIAVLLALTVAAIAFTTIVSNASLRIDCTAERLYTLSSGSKAVLGKLDNDVTFKYYVSSSSAQMPMVLKTYATRVENLLREYERAGKGRLVLEIYDPKPDSDAEEWAQRYGIEPQNVAPFGQSVYFGLVAVCGDREETLGVLSPRTESTLEYDLTRLVTRVAWPERPVIGVMTSLPGVLPGGDARTGGGWAAFSELAKDYDVRAVATDAKEIPAEIKTLILLHAKALKDETLYAVDQFVLRGGRLVACLDPFCIKEAMSLANAGAGNENAQPGSSSLGRLLESWGVGFDTLRVVCDLSSATKLNDGRGGFEDNPALLSLGAAAMDRSDILVSRLSNILIPFAGALRFTGQGTGIEFSPVLTTSREHSCDIDRSRAQYGLAAMGGELGRDGEGRVVAARLSGLFKSSYPQGPTGTNAVEGALLEGRGSVMLFGDADFLADEFCVRMLRTPFGQIPQLINDNLALFANVVEQFAGREELIGVRSRGAGDRPFEVVNKLEAEAMAKWQRREAEFQNELRETQHRLAELQQRKNGEDRYVLSKEQQDEILRLRKAQAATRRQLKNVRRELTADIDSLGLTLKCINIGLMPLLVVIFGLVRGLLRRRG